MKYKKHGVDESGFTEWIYPSMEKYKASCCDCGLVHEFIFSIDEKRIKFKVRRDNRATGQKRRKLGVSVYK